MSGFTTLDIAGLAWLATAWLGYTVVADHTRLKQRSITSVMNAFRQRWMLAMIQRELRIIDTSIVGNLLRGVGFFASTSIILVGGLMAALGGTEEAMTVVADLPMVTPTSRPVWEMKILLLVAMFIYAFFKIAWAFRLFTNCSILIGAAPLPPVEPERARKYAAHAGRALGFASENFNLGMRAYFFALGTIWWMLNPVAFIAATTLVVIVLYRREFHSRTLTAVREVLDLAADVPDRASRQG